MPSTLLLLLILHLSATSARRMANFPMREIADFRSYRDATLLHFRIPEQVQTASWNFTSWEKKIYGISSCEPRPVNVYLKHGSYPVVSLDDSAYPENYFQRNETLHEIHFTSNNVPNFINLTTPLPGDWFAVVFNNYTDPDDDAIQQSGLVLVCVALLESNVDVILVKTMNVIIPQHPIKKKLNDSNPIEQFKFFVPKNISLVNIKLTGLESSRTKSVISSVVKLDTSVIYSGDKTLTTECRTAGNCEVHFIPSDHSWIYVTVTLIPNETSEVDFSLEIKFDKTITNDCNKTDASQNGTFQNCWINVPMTRHTYTGFFTYGFDQTPYENGTEIATLNVTVKVPTLMTFEVNPIQDIGGTLSFEINMDMDGLKEYLNDYNVLLLACVSHEVRLLPQFPGKCISSSGLLFPNQLQVNSTSESSKTNVKRLHIPFPEYGRWFLSLQPFCYTLDTDAELIEANCSKLDMINVSFIAESLPCGPDNCGQYGRCITQMDGGLLFSSCACMHGYRGWGCTDASKVAPQYEHLIAALLLTLSNLFFIPAIIVAVRRRFYTEGLVYACTMFFSTFYHACNAGDGVYSFCMFNLGVLQFCDFYTAIMAVWVTIIAMAAIPSHLSSLAHMAGAVFIALGTEYNRTSLWVFLFPIIIGVVIMVTSWVLRCRRTRACYPDKSYWMYFFPPGLILIVIGLMCFSFLQTQRNYKYVHSAWHSIMALSILLVLPRVQKSGMVLDGVVDELQEIRSESQSPTDSSSWTWNFNCDRWCLRKK